MTSSALAPAPPRAVVTTDPADGARAYHPRGAARELWLCRDGEVVLEGPAGTGKSRAGLEKLHALALKYPGMRAAICRKTRVSMTESTLVTFEEHVLLPGDPMVVDGPMRASRRSYVYPNGSEIVVAGLDRPSRLMSTEFDVVYVAEATELFENDWEMLTTRLRNGRIPYQQIIADCNPEAPSHWLHQRCDGGRTTVFYSRHEDNPVLFDHRAGDWTERGRVYLDRLDRLTGVRLERLRHGKRAGVEGAVYAFDRRVHLVDAFDIPPDWPRYRVIDFGFTHPFVCIWAATDADGRAYVYRELYMTRRTVSEHGAKIAELSAGETYARTWSDHDPEAMAVLRSLGIVCEQANKDMKAGRQLVMDRLKVQPDGKPRLVLMRDILVERDDELYEARQPVCTEQEFDAYVYPKASDGRVVKEDPIKDYDHGMDCLRYLCMGLVQGMPASAMPRANADDARSRGGRGSGRGSHQRAAIDRGKRPGPLSRGR